MWRFRFNVKEVEIGRYDKFRSLSNCRYSVRSSFRRGCFSLLQEVFSVTWCFVVCWVSEFESVSGLFGRWESSYLVHHVRVRISLQVEFPELAVVNFLLLSQLHRLMFL